ncbi:MAG: hypothetical protein ACK56F_27385 [bacterium]
MPPLAPLPRRPACWNCCFFLWKGATAATGSPAWSHSSSAGVAADTAATAAITGNAERKASGLCRFHWKYGEEARICTKPCTWTGN